MYKNKVQNENNSAVTFDDTHKNTNFSANISDSSSLVINIPDRPDNTLEYNSARMKALIINNKLSLDNLPNNVRIDFLTSLQGMSYSELEVKEKAFQKSKLDQYLDGIKGKKYYQYAVSLIDLLKLSKAYMVEAVFNDGRLVEEPRIHIRKSGTQGRHVTPIALIERIIMNTLIKGYTITEIMYGLYSKVEIFKKNCSENENDFIQSVFDYFSNYENRTPQGVVLFIKIMMHFYHENLSVTMYNDCINIPYKLNNCYLVPTLEYNTNQYIHANEGSFVKAILNILAAFNDKLAANIELSEKEQAQLFYAVKAIFDYLPLPAKAKNRMLKPNTSKHRYRGETIDRLTEIGARHLMFIFEAYPSFLGKYAKKMIESFCTFLSDGVTEEELYKAVGAKDITDLFQKLEDNGEAVGYSVEELYNNFITINKGFAGQYADKKDSEQFFNIIKTAINKELEGRINLSDHVNASIEMSFEKSSESDVESKEIIRDTTISQTGQIATETSNEEESLDQQKDYALDNNSSKISIHNKSTSSEVTSEGFELTMDSTSDLVGVNFQARSFINLEEGRAIFENFSDARIFQTILQKIGLTESSSIFLDSRKIHTKEEYKNEEKIEKYHIQVTPYEWYFIQQNNVIINNADVLISYQPSAALLPSVEFQGSSFNLGEPIGRHSSSENEPSTPSLVINLRSSPSPSDNSETESTSTMEKSITTNTIGR